jgi:DNA polymerase-3 subunit epsilon
MNFPRPADRLAAMAALLESSDEYRVLRRLGALPRFDGSLTDPTVRLAAFVDTETTGLLPSDEIIEFAMISFAYSLDGNILGVCDSFEAFRDPGRPIPPAVTALTKISDEMVAGKHIDQADIATRLAPVALVVAQNAQFDRAHCERLFPPFADKPWACSLNDIAWKDEGFINGTKLANLTNSLGYFFDGHRALDDCRAGIAVLAAILPVSGRSAMAALLESARKPRWRIRAIGAPYAHRALLKNRGYHWHDGSDGRARAWFVDVSEDQVDPERSFLHEQVYGRQDVDIPCQHLTALERYSERV